MQRAISVLLFPATLAISIGGAVLAIEAGATAGAVIGFASLFALATVAAFERIQPFLATWNHSRGDLAADLAYFPTTLGVNAAVEPAARIIAVYLGAALSGAVGSSLWPGGWPLTAQLLLACVVAEFFDYWPHRILHERPRLWRFHAIHHSPERLYWLNATRSHPLEIGFRAVFSFLPLAMLGASAEVLTLYGLVTSVVGLYQHANIDFALGPLSWIFSVGEMHRWHHSDEPREADHNYGNNFLFWDVVFGTHYRPAARRAPDRIGIRGEPAFTNSWLDQLIAPFRIAP